MILVGQEDVARGFFDCHRLSRGDSVSQNPCTGIRNNLEGMMDLLSHGEKLSVHQLVGKINIGLSQPEIYRYLSLLNLAPEVQEMVSEGELGVKLASQLATVEKEKQEEVAKLITETSTEDQS